MINLGWNTRGRIDRATYNKERWRHFAFCLIPVALFVLGGLVATTSLVWLSVVAWVAGFILITYYRYRFIQVMVRRLHDRNMSGWLIVLSPLILALIFGAIAGYVFMDAYSILPAWLSGETFMNGFGYAVIAIIVLYGIFLRFQLQRPGTPGLNKYGLPPGDGQAQVF